MKITALAGGVGAARFLSGFVEAFPEAELTIIVNTGDDFDWLGLRICPDIDTVIYTLAGIADPAAGWGIRGDTFHCLRMLETLGHDAWFRMGDRDLASSLERTSRLRRGERLADITRDLARAHGVKATVLPVTDDPVPTMVHTTEGTLAFQDYFVRRRHEPRVTGITSLNVENARPAPGVLEALQEASGIVICPSNPIISIGPILAVPGIREALRSRTSPAAAVSPIIAGEAVKGPAATMMADLGMEASSLGVARMYSGLVDVFVMDARDGPLAEREPPAGMVFRTAQTLMDTVQSRTRLAKQVVEIMSWRS